MAQLFSLPKARPLDTGGKVRPGSKLTFTTVGTLTAATVYTDPACTIQHSSPVVADGNGEFAAIYFNNDRDVYLTTSTGTPIWGPVTLPVGGISRTNAEIAASVTPSNYSYRPGDIMRYGATVDGTTDDYLAFSKALLSNGYVYSSKAGTCLIGTSIDMQTSTTLDLSGLKLIAKVQDWVSAGVVRAKSVDNVVIRGGWIDGQKASNSTGRVTGVDIRGATNVRVENVRVTNCPGLTSAGQHSGDGIYIGYDGSTVPENIVVSGCICDGNVRQGMSVVGVDGLTVTGSHFLGTTGSDPGAGIDLEADDVADTLRSITIAGNVFEGGYYGVIATTGAKHVAITGNTFRANRYHDVFLGDCDYVTVTGNTVISTGKVLSPGSLVYMQNANNIVVSANVLQGSGTDAEEAAGISVRDANVVQISNNVIRLTRTQGVLIGNSDITTAFADVVVEGNMFADCVDSASSGTAVIAVSGNNTGPVSPARVTIRNNHIYDSRSAGNECDNAISISTNISAATQSGYRVEGNTVSGPALAFVNATYPPLSNALTWNPGNLIDGAGETSSAITVTGAALGDTVQVFPPYDLQAILCTGYVSATNTVTIRLQNETGGPIDLANGSWLVRVRKFYE